MREKLLIIKEFPSFSPEIFKEIQNDDPMKTKQLEKGLGQLTDEGVCTTICNAPGNRKIIGTVGELQFGSDSIQTQTGIWSNL